MNNVSKPPPSPGVILAAAAAGGFVGAVGGAIVATNMMGEPTTDVKIEATAATEQALVAENED